MILSSEGLLDRDRDQFAVRYEDMHPVLQDYHDRCISNARHTFARIIAHAREDEIDFVKSFISRHYAYFGIQHSGINKLTEDIIEYCKTRITENDIEYYR